MAKRGSKSRNLSAQEQSLWQKVTKDVIANPNIKPPEAMPETILDAVARPVKRRNLKSTAAPILPKKSAEIGHLAKLMQRFEEAPTKAQKKLIKAPSYANSYYNETQHSQPQNLPLDRNIRQKLQRGRADVEAQLDLHGYNRNNAQTKLMSFLRSSWQQGFKTVIVVTGKGDGSIARHSLHSADFFTMPEQRAVLRASIADWLNSAEASQFVIGWQPAHPKHGGGGAVYVRLRSRGKHR